MYTKRENDEFKLLVTEAAFLTENREEMGYSKEFPTALISAMSAVGTGTAGIMAILAVFAGMSGAQIMAALAAFGFGGAVGGIASIALVVLSPAILVAGGVYTLASQNVLKQELKKLVELSYKFEALLEADTRENANGVVQTIKLTREHLLMKHKLFGKKK